MTELGKYFENLLKIEKRVLRLRVCVIEDADACSSTKNPSSWTLNP
jgi:hypothetical protein